MYVNYFSEAVGTIFQDGNIRTKEEFCKRREKKNQQMEIAHSWRIRGKHLATDTK